MLRILLTTGLCVLVGCDSCPTTDLPGQRPALLSGTGELYCAVKGDAAWCWGVDDSKQATGRPGTLNLVQRVPSRLAIEERVVGVAAGDVTGCALTSTGCVFCWGLLPGRGGTQHSPQRIGGVGEVVELAASEGSNLCVRRLGNRVACWGANVVGEVGNGNREPVWSPSEVPGLKDVEQLSLGGGFSCARTANRQVLCWGYNYGLDGAGFLGRGPSPGNPLVPNPVSDLVDAVDISAGDSSGCAVRATGRVVCWGVNLSGQLGDGTTEGRSRPVEVLDLTDAVEVSVGARHACARRLSGGVACWGDNDAGQLGVSPFGAQIRHLRPVAVQGLTDAVQVAVGGLSSCARRATGSIVCWGGDIFGEQGRGEHRSHPEPLPVLGFE